MSRILFALLLLAGLVPAAVGQTIYTPLAGTAVTGFTADVVANGRGAAAASTSASFDQGMLRQPNYCLFARDYVTPTGTTVTQGLPLSGLLQNTASTTPNLLFQLQPYTANNSLRLAGTATGSLTLATPQATQSVWVAAAVGNGDGSGNNPVTMTVVFSDGTTQAFSYSVSDWFDGTNFIVTNLGRVARLTDVIDLPTDNPRLYQFELALLPANYGKLVSQVQFAKIQPTGNTTPVVLNVMAVTLATVCGLPTATVAAAPASVCPGQSTQLTATLTGGGGSYTQQWQSSPDGTTWTSIPNATGLTYTAIPTANTFYRLRIVCNSAATAVSPAVQVTVVVATATLAYSAAAYCRTGTSGVPTAQPAGGRFSAPAGLAINAATGELDLTSSTAGTYLITYTSAGQCPATATASVLIKSDALPVFPNIITPDGDGLNDALRFKFQYPADLSGFRLQVFNRWGRRVYEGTNPTTGWDAAESSAGTYYYLVEFTDCANHAQRLKNWVEVVK